MRCRWLVLSALMLVACGGGAEGPRTSGDAGGAGTNTGGSATGGVTSPVAGAPGGGQAGAPMNGGSAGAVSTGGSAGGGTGPVGPTERPDLRTVVYLPDWRGPLSMWQQRIDFSRITYLNLCFAEADAAGNVTYSDAGLDAFVSVAHAAGVKVCMAIGGASVIADGGVYSTILQDGQREAFVSKLSDYATAHQLDCIDVDLEGNGVNQYYEAFVTALADRLHANGKEMTSAVSSWFGNKISDAAIQSFDFINVMAYDLHNPGGASQPVQSSSIADATAEVEYWIGRGLAKSKAVYGVPFYGYRWNASKSEALTYAEILAADPAAATQDQVQVGGAVTFLNSRATIQAKAVLAKQYGGIMVWELGQDAAGDASLLKAIHEAK